jgi:hypothetical protein
MPRPACDGRWVTHGGSKGEVVGVFFWGMGSRMVDVCEGCGWDGGARVRLHGAYFVPRGFFSRGVRWVKGRKER